MRCVAVAVFAMVVSTSSGASILPFGITFDGGKLGVNFFGFNAGVEIGNKDGRGGGLHVEAGTPFGQRAAAGLGGNIDGRQMGGGLYAGATAGGNIAASAGLNGDLGSSGNARGSLFSRASVGPLAVEKSLDKNVGQKDEHIVEHVVETSNPHDDFEMIPKKTKTKTKKVVKEVEMDSDEVYTPIIRKELTIGSRHSEDEVDHVKEIPPPVVVRKHYHKTVSAGSDASRGVGYGTSELNAFLSPTYKRQVASHDDDEDDDDNQTKHRRPSSGVHVQKEVVYRNQHRPSFFEDIFNIPISTLGAVSRFLSNSAGKGGAVDVRKTVSYN